MIVVKAPPHISTKYQETVCSAGVTEDGEWIRLYPLNFRKLPVSKWFKKYQWIEVEVEKHNDPRPESFRPKIDTLRLGGKLDTKNNWAKRKEILLPVAVSSMEEVYRNFQDEYTSLAVFKPKEVTDLIMVPAKERSASAERIQNQINLFEGAPKQLDHIEYKFKYNFSCYDEDCTGHSMTIEDWEIQELYRFAIGKFGEYAIDKILDYVKVGWLDNMWSEKHDSYLIVGNMARTKSFIVLGVFRPKK